MPFEPKVDVDEDCLICCEPLNHDLNFYPCPCEFQLCSMCWHRIKNDEDNKCPNCRELYGDEPFKWGPLTPEQEVALKELRSKESSQNTVSKPKPVVAPTIASIELNRDRLSQVRVLQKNLVFVVGLSTQIAQEQVLRRNEYFGKYGKILKVAVNQSTSYAGTQGPSASAYVTYNTTDAALKCIQEVNGSYQDGRTLKATLGTTKYCSRFLNGQQCKLTDCMYLHEVAEEEASFTKEDMSKQKHSEYEKSLMDAFTRRQREKHEKEIKTRALAKAQAEADARMKAEMLKQKNRQRAEAEKKKESPSTPPTAKSSRISMSAEFKGPSTTPSLGSILSGNSSANQSSSSSLSANQKQKKEKPKTKKEIEKENEKKKRTRPKQIEESEEEKEEEEVKDAWDSSDEEIEPVESPKEIPPPPQSTNQRIESSTSNQKTGNSTPAEKPKQTATPPPLPPVTTKEVSSNKKESKSKKEEIHKSQKLENKKSQKHKTTNETQSVPKQTTSNGEQKVHETVPKAAAQKQVEKTSQNDPKESSERPKSRKSPLAQIQKTPSPNPTQNLAQSVAGVIAERILTPSPPTQSDSSVKDHTFSDPFRLSAHPLERPVERRNSVDQKPGSGFDPFMFGSSNGMSGTERADSRPHSTHSSNSGTLNGTVLGSQGPPFGGNSLLSQLEKRPSPPGISQPTNQMPSGPPGLGVSQIGSSIQKKLDLGPPLSINTRPPNALQSKSHFDPFDFKKPTVIQGLSNGNPGNRNLGGGLPNGGPNQRPGGYGAPLNSPFGSSHDGGLNMPFPKPTHDFRSQPPPPGLGLMDQRPKNDLDWLPQDLSRGISDRFGRNDFDQRSKHQFPQPSPDPFRGFHNGFGGLENGIGRPKRQEPKADDDLGFDPSQFALDQLDLTRSKFNDINLNHQPRQTNKPRTEHWNSPYNNFGQSSNIFSGFGDLGGRQPMGHGSVNRQQPPVDLRNSQDMLRRLLPNVNVSFNNESSLEGNFGQMKSYGQVRNPPPGFGQYQPDTSSNGPILPSNLLNDFD